MDTLKSFVRWFLLAALVPAAALAGDKGSAKEHYLRANALYDAGGLDQAMVEYNTAIALNTRFTRAYQRRALTWYALGAHELAIEDSDRAVEIDPSDAWSYGMRGDAWLALGKPGHAVADYTTALRLGSDSADLYFRRAEGHKAAANNQAAVRDYGRALDRNPKLVAAYRERGNLRLVLGEQRDGERDLRAASRLTVRDGSSGSLAAGFR